MSSLYGPDLLRMKDSITKKPPLGLVGLSGKLNKERGNFAEKWSNDRMTKAMEGAVWAALPRIHDEVKLHTHGRRLFNSLRKLRDAEDVARERLKSSAGSKSVEKIVRAYKCGVGEVVDPFGWAIDKAMSLVDEENAAILSEEDRTTIYFAAAVLHTALIIWEDAADALASLEKTVTLDFEDMDCEGIVSVVDVAEKAIALYGEVQRELSQLAKKNRKLSAAQIKDAAQMLDGGVTPDGITLELRENEVRYARLAQQDAEIAASQMASLASHALDWQRAAPMYRAAMGAVADVSKRLETLASNAATALRGCVALLDRLPHHLLLARNVAYIAIQGDEEMSMRRAAEVIAAEMKIDVDAVWRVEILGRRPLCEENHIASKFENKIPKLLKLNGDTK
jgi:hypothetical protein